MFDAASLQLSQSKLILPITVPRDSGQFAEEEPAPDISCHPGNVLQSGATEFQVSRGRGRGSEVKDCDDIELQVGLLTFRLDTTPPGEAAAQLQPGDQQTSGQPSPRSHSHQLRLSGQQKYQISRRR